MVNNGKLTALNQMGLFQQLRWRMFSNGARVMIDQRLLQMIAIGCCCVVIWGLAFLMSGTAFAWLKRQQGQQTHLLTGDMAGLVFDPLFFSLGALLFFSTCLILYSSLFTSKEAGFLLGMPVDADQVFAYKYHGALAYSSWGFLLLGSPMLIAYGVVAQVSWPFYVLLLPFFLGFVLLPGSLGALVCLLVANCLPRQRKQVVRAVVLLVLIAAAVWVFSVARTARSGMFTRDVGFQLQQQLSFTQSPLLPTFWLARGLRSAADNQLSQASYYLGLIWINGLFFYVLTAWLARRFYRRGYNRVATGSTLRRRYGGAWLDHLLSRAVGFVNPQTRLLIIKDFRAFRRDPVQWAQILIFLGLMTLYLTNIRRLSMGGLTWEYENGISLLNLSATALLLCSYTGRFIFPMLSLEGQKFWILGLLPWRRERLLWGKFAFAACGGLVIAEFLIVLSDVMLGIPWPALAIHVLTVAVLTTGLSGLSVGLGTVMPNFKETDPSKIAVGFGGTLNLVVGLLFILVVIGLMAAPWHAQAAPTAPSALQGPAVAWAIGFGLVLGTAIGAAAVIVPMRAGARALARMEF